MHRFVYPFLLLVAACVCSSSARADLIELANGGKIHGEIANADDKQATTYDIKMDGGGRVTLPRSQVARVISQSRAQEEYHRRARAVANSVDGHWQLAQWCRDRKLVDEYREQLEQILELDPNHEQARLGLGHQKQRGGWQSRDDVMAARGLVLYDGKYYTQHHVELLKRAKEAKLVDADWNSRLDRWRRWLTGRRQERSAEAERELRALRDPAAAPAVVDLLLEEQNPDVKRLLLEVAVELDHPRVLDALVHLSLTDPNDVLRSQALDALIATGRPGVAGPYVRALRSNDNVIVNRAAEALGVIGDRDAIGPLISALVTKHKGLVGSGSPDQHAYTFTPSGGTSMNFGGGGPKVVTREIENPAALAAIAKLSGVNFGFDQNAWRGWLTAEAKAHPVDVRRDQ
jgi:HEAT repeats